MLTRCTRQPPGGSAGSARGVMSGDGAGGGPSNPGRMWTWGPKQKNMPKKPKPTPSARAVGYVRVSTHKQQMSPAAQEQKIRQLAELQDVKLLKVCVDRESAKEGSMQTRPALQEVLDLARRGEINRVIVAKLDRLTRSVVDLGGILTLLDKRNVALVSAMETWMDTGSAAGRMIINIITAVAQWEREAIGERTREILQYKRAKGEVYCSTLPYGFRRVGRPRPGRLFAGMKLVPLPAEQAVIREMQKLRRRGLTLRAIADRLNGRKVPTKTKGATWRASQVDSILRLAEG